MITLWLVTFVAREAKIELQVQILLDRGDTRITDSHGIFSHEYQSLINRRVDTHFQAQIQPLEAAEFSFS